VRKRGILAMAALAPPLRPIPPLPEAEVMLVVPNVVGVGAENEL
jgi:hypothetical protein